MALRRSQCPGAVTPAMAMHAGPWRRAGVWVLGRRATMPESQDIVLTTCPRDCYDACGLAVIKEHGAIVRVRGDRNHPVNRGSLCGKCAIAYNGVLRDPRAR